MEKIISKTLKDIEIYKQIIKDESSKIQMIQRVMNILPDMNSEIYSKVVSKMPYCNRIDGNYSGINYLFQTYKFNKQGMERVAKHTTQVRLDDII